MKKLHIALATSDLDASVADYSARLETAPCSVVPGAYALWRTESVNLSVRQDRSCEPGTLRHLGWEDSAADAFSEEKDVNGLTWERFTAAQQAEEINRLWPNAGYDPGE